MGRSRRALAAGALVAVAAVLIGCEDTPVTPGEGWTIDVVAQPSVVTVDATSGDALATIIATVANDTGVPQSGVSVIFSNAGGELASGSAGVETDGAGRAVDTLTVREADPDSIVVTASSGALTDSVTVTKSTAEPDLPPVAAITATPANQQASGQSVVFDGGGSSDPDTGDVITMYRWRITSTNPDTGVTNPQVFEGPGLESIGIPGPGTPAFTNVQNLLVELSVTDDPTAPTKFALGRPFTYRATTTIPYAIVSVSCATNARPVAVIAGADSQTVAGNGQTEVQFQLDGSLSSDAEGSIATYTWSCGNGSAPPPSSPVVTCTYAVDTVTRTYSATLVVRDQGIAGGQCVQSSTQDAISVVVTP